MRSAAPVNQVEEARMNAGMQTAARPRALFPVGQLVRTRGAVEVMRAEVLRSCGGAALPEDVVDTRAIMRTLALVKRHQRGDWGNLGPDDARANLEALAHGTRTLSAYELPSGKLWVITEADRSITTVLTPEEY